MFTISGKIDLNDIAENMNQRKIIWVNILSSIFAIKKLITIPIVDLNIILYNFQQKYLTYLTYYTKKGYTQTVPVGQPYWIYSINIFKLKKKSIVVKKMNVYCSHVNNANSFGGKITQP